MSGKIVHFEVPYDNGARARSFYRDAFGWQVMDIPGMDYTSVSTGPAGDDGMPSEPGYIGGGMFQRTDDYPRTPVITVEVDDIEAALKKIESLGGKGSIPKFAVGEMGFAAYFTDTEGNTIGLWETAGG
ncbi:VOC family protein [Aldersonia kunmingensis]|uniref:VOC family protein n=1 Tax=Aldersonia kunmingensis TaxID=408066 RepID=UPI0008323E8E|nr:VOC family protein [Aldersonia kunmingensis]